ncbi:amino acid adenylation domain-containing protein [Hydrogenophaga sp.]|uniref:non-ribosomal peptide synthetase n=1 Tax=Hydrogenophaga sp. TaxID=1904254 RepID=UPI003F6E8177
MSDTIELIKRLHGLDIHLKLDGDRLGVNAPKGAVTPELREELGRRKDEVKAYLKEQGATTSDGALQRPLRVPPLERAVRGADMPVSHTQQRLWFIKRMDPSSHVYNVANVMRFTGPFDEAVLERSLDDLVVRHESLRTRFIEVDGVPRCVIEPRARVTLERIDLLHLPEPQREAAGVAAAEAFSRRPFDLARAPLLHVALIRIAADVNLFVFVFDHIVSDGLSIGIFMIELQALYARHAIGTDDGLPPLPIQYIDYVEWERRCFELGTIDRHVNFWKQQLADLPSLLQLPTDRPRPPVQTTRGSRRVAQFSPVLSERIKAFGRAEGSTLFMVLMSAFQVLLHRYSGETDIAIGSAIANRNRTEIERVIGFFANNIVLRADLTGNPTVRELMARVREMALKSYAHQEMPFDMLVDVIGARRELDHSPLFQVMFVLQNLSLTGLELPHLECGTMELPVSTARFDIAVDVFDLAAGLRIYFEYNTDLFDDSTIARMQAHYEHLLEGFIATPEARIGDLPMLSAREEQQLLLGWNDTAVPYPTGQTVHGLFEAQVARTPDAVAVRFEDSTLSYAQLNARANQLAHRLRALGAGRESLIGVWMERSADMVVAVLGVLKSGAAYVPLDPAFPKDRIDYMMEDAELRIVVTQDGLAQGLPTGVQSVCLDTGASTLAALSADNPAPLAGAGDLAYVIYTSGSTGRPKGVMLEHRAVVNFLLSMHREPGITAADRFVAVTTLSFDIAGLEIHGPLTVGGTVVLASRATALDGLRLAELLDHSEATLLQATPATWRLLLESGWRGRRGLKMLCGGEGLPRDLADKLLATGGELWNMYGPTETTIWSTISRVLDTTRAISIGRPIANTQVYVLEPSGLPAPIGVGGELCIGGAGLARGYRHRDELTAEKFVTLELPGVGPTRVYRTGDVVRFLADGRMEFVGRRDHQVKVRGFRIELGEIETVLARHSGVKDCVVHVREDTPGDQRLVAYVVPEPGATVEAEGVRATLRVQLPEYMIPNLFVVLEALPLTPNGKVDRKALPAPVVASVGAADDPGEAVMTPVQRQVAGLWRTILNVERVGLHANFFDLGGHSLLLVRLQAAMQREFGQEFPLVELFQRTTVAAQAERMSTPAGASGALERARARAAKQIQG